MTDHNELELLQTAQIDSAEILAVGTELLMGQIVNTNAAYLAHQLRDLGIFSYYQTVVGDNHERVIQAIHTALSRTDLLIMTGGLGPTADDISMACAAEACGRNLIFHQAEWDKITAYFARTGRKAAEINRKQAMLPENSLILPNNNGTAPGALIPLLWQQQPRFVVLLPGPPLENHLMFQDYVRPVLLKHTRHQLKSVFLHLTGIGESEVETRIQDLITQQHNPTIAPYCSEGEVTLRLTQLCDDDQDPDLITPVKHELYARLGQYVYEEGERKLPEVVKDLLAGKHLTVSFAESCTAGLMSSQFGDLPGVSQVFLGSVVSYADSAKENLLQVPAFIIQQDGAVSEACAKAMASGCRERFGSDYGVAITGIAGPDGGSADKPVGTVWLAVADVQGIVSKLHHFQGSRAKIRRLAALKAYDLLRRRMLNLGE
ncbi:MAG: competence/damage-inducible protein A [Oscillospiraceae bacterium]|nr:competence/damage-inducible protein A [Oscillospiraceae bacterium]MDD4368792.1 competence/damage-inducible protein A [Oscillospiraceae bacterium]